MVQADPDVGLHTSVEREELHGWCERYLEQSETDPLGAAQTIVRTIMTSIARSIGADRWVDTTPANARKADRVEPIYPDSTVIVVNRDGRDVASRLFTKHSVPTTSSKPWPSGSSAWDAYTLRHDARAPIAY